MSLKMGIMGKSRSTIYILYRSTEVQLIMDNLKVDLVDQHHKVNENRLKLKEAMILFIKMNNDYYMKFKATKQLEGQISCIDIKHLDSEKSLLISKLRYFLCKLESDNHGKSKEELRDLSLLYDQKQRLAQALNCLIEDFNSKMVESRVHEVTEVRRSTHLKDFKHNLDIREAEQVEAHSQYEAKQIEAHSQYEAKPKHSYESQYRDYSRRQYKSVENVAKHKCSYHHTELGQR